MVLIEAENNHKLREPKFEYLGPTYTASYILKLVKYIGLYIQGVPLATEPSISLIILTPMKILQRNLNKSTFVV